MFLGENMLLAPRAQRPVKVASTPAREAAGRGSTTRHLLDQLVERGALDDLGWSDRSRVTSPSGKQQRVPRPA